MKKRAQGSLFLCPNVRLESEFRSGNGEGAVHFFEEALQHFARAYFDGFGRSQFNHLVHALCPAYRGGQLRDEVLANDFRIGFRRGVDVLDHWASRRLERRCSDGSGEAFPCGFHQRRVECSTYGQHEGPTSTGLCEGGTRRFDGRNFS